MPYHRMSVTNTSIKSHYRSTSNAENSWTLKSETKMTAKMRNFWVLAKNNVRYLEVTQKWPNVYIHNWMSRLQRSSCFIYKGEKPMQNPPPISNHQRTSTWRKLNNYTIKDYMKAKSKNRAHKVAAAAAAVLAVRNYLESIILTTINVLLINCLLSRHKVRILRPRRERHPSII